MKVFATATQGVIARIKAGEPLNGVAVHPDGKRVYIPPQRQGHRPGDRRRNQPVVATMSGGKATVEHNEGAYPRRKKTLRRVCGRSNAVAVIDTTDISENC